MTTINRCAHGLEISIEKKSDGKYSYDIYNSMGAIILNDSSNTLGEATEDAIEACRAIKDTEINDYYDYYRNNQ